jgi:hypothetical protein
VGAVGGTDAVLTLAGVKGVFFLSTRLKSVCVKAATHSLNIAISAISRPVTALLLEIELFDFATF